MDLHAHRAVLHLDNHDRECYVMGTTLVHSIQVEVDKTGEIIAGVC